MKISVAAILLIVALGCVPLPHNKTFRVTSYEQLETLVGKQVEFVGVVSNAKCPDVLGVDLWELDSYRGKTVRLKGRLKQEVVTREQLDEQEKRMGGMFANRGPGTFYSLDRMTFEVLDSNVAASP